MTDLTSVVYHPILFSGAMVRAILEGRKTQTRRVIKPQPAIVTGRDGVTPVMRWRDRIDTPLVVGPDCLRRYCPYGAPGDRLWVRETWAASLDSDGDMQEPIIYRATYDESLYGPLVPRFDARATEIWDTVGNTGWRPSIHMPRAYSRITLEVTGVRVERVQDITLEDARREGCEEPDWPRYYKGELVFDAREAFQHLWNDINGPRGYGWQVNPWVWVVEFKRMPS